MTVFVLSCGNGLIAGWLHNGGFIQIRDDSTHTNFLYNKVFRTTMIYPELNELRTYVAFMFPLNPDILGLQKCTMPTTLASVPPFSISIWFVSLWNWTNFVKFRPMKPFTFFTYSTSAFFKNKKWELSSNDENFEDYVPTKVKRQTPTWPNGRDDFFWTRRTKDWTRWRCLCSFILILHSLL